MNHDPSIDNVLITEDDILFNKNIFNDWYYMRQHLPEDWDAIKFGNIVWTADGKEIKYASEMVKNNDYWLKTNEYPDHHFWQCHMIALRKPLLEHICNEYRVNYFPANNDNIMAERLQHDKNWNIYVANPMLAIQNKDLLSDTRGQQSRHIGRPEFYMDIKKNKPEDFG